MDLVDAYKLVMVRPEDWHLLGSSWINDSDVTKYNVDHVLPFGMRSSTLFFNQYANGLEFAMNL